MNQRNGIVRSHSRLAWALSVSAVAVCTITACSGTTPVRPPTTAPSALTQLPRPLSATEQQLVNGSNQFAFSLFRVVDSAAGPDSNVFISPLSASMALGMTTIGAAGSTLDSMRAVLGYDDIPVSQMADSYHFSQRVLAQRSLCS